MACQSYDFRSRSRSTASWPGPSRAPKTPSASAGRTSISGCSRSPPGGRRTGGRKPPFHHPVFVLTHHARPPLALEGGTTVTFVTDGITSALAQARRAALA